MKFPLHFFFEIPNKTRGVLRHLLQYSFPSFSPQLSSTGICLWQFAQGSLFSMALLAISMLLRNCCSCLFCQSICPTETDISECLTWQFLGHCASDENNLDNRNRFNHFQVFSVVGRLLPLVRPGKSGRSSSEESTELAEDEGVEFPFFGNNFSPLSLNSRYNSATNSITFS